MMYSEREGIFELRDSLVGFNNQYFHMLMLLNIKLIFNCVFLRIFFVRFNAINISLV